MLSKLITIAALGAVASAALAFTADEVQQNIALKDGSTVYVFKDGKMSMEDRFGRVVRMQPGHVMEAKDGRQIIMVGDEVARLDAIRQAKRNGSQ